MRVWCVSRLFPIVSSVFLLNTEVMSDTSKVPVKETTPKIECDVSEPWALLKKEKYPDHKFSRQEINSALESARIDNNVTIEIMTTGCVDGRWRTITFEIKNAEMHAQQPLYWIEFAKEQLRKVSWADDFLLRDLLKFLEKAKILQFVEEKGVISTGECNDDSKPDIDGCKWGGHWLKLKSSPKSTTVTLDNSETL